MNNQITITASDGVKLEDTLDNYAALVNRLKKYEADLEAKKTKEEAERKKRAEVEASVRQYRETKLKEINDDLSKVSEKIDAYEKQTGYKIIYGIDYGTGKAVVQDTRNSIDFAWDILYKDILDVIHKKK